MSPVPDTEGSLGLRREKRRGVCGLPGPFKRTAKPGQEKMAMQCVPERVCASQNDRERPGLNGHAGGTADHLAKAGDSGSHDFQMAQLFESLLGPWQHPGVGCVCISCTRGWGHLYGPQYTPDSSSQSQESFLMREKKGGLLDAF